jgi:hypothetical protein
MDGLSFVAAAPPVESDPARADIACFMGFVARRAGPLAAERATLQTALGELGWTGPALPTSERLIPENVVPAGQSSRAFCEWLSDVGWKRTAETGKRSVPEQRLFEELLRVWVPPATVDWWSATDYLNRAGQIPAVDLLELNDVPVPVDTWGVFDALFAWDARPLGNSAGRCDTALGSAVRSFFAQGGRKAYVVRLGDPWPVITSAAERTVERSAYRLSTAMPSAVERASWRGIGHLFALPEVSFLCLPDLPDLFGTTPLRLEKPRPAATAEVFVECSSREESRPNLGLRGIPAPGCDEGGFQQWAELVRSVGEFLSRSAREVQFVGAIPLPIGEAALSGQAQVAQRIRQASDAQWKAVATIGTAFVQLAYPWLRTRHSALLPGGVEAPDGTLVGSLANSALTRGSWRSAIRQPVPGITAVQPALDRAMLARDLSPRNSRGQPLTLRDRITVIGQAPGGFRLLSDVTTDDEEAYRPANVNRLLNAILRAARVAGAPAVFQNNGPALWARLRESLEGLLAGLWADGALDGAAAEDAYEVRCDRSTISQADLDAGRVICRASFTAASPIVHITVLLAMDEAGHISLASRQAVAAPQIQAA